MGSIRNTVVVAILQVGVVVAAVLAAGICHRVWMSGNLPVPRLIALLCHFGFAGLLIPLVWITGAAMLHTRPGVSDDARALMFWLGVLVLVALTIFALYADVSPWLVYLRMPEMSDDGG
ncbi:MAG TPA: hypothetical protein VME24_10505 [Alphaproteobacteria bacterium]|nr:hypothetical protein [Alphaproteobacteria bacterium]